MTDRIKGFVVTLENDMREDDARRVVKAIELIKGVVSVGMVESNVDDYVIRQRIKNELSDKLSNLLKDV